MFWLNLKYGLRSTKKNAGVTAVVILTLAVTIGVNITIFSLLNAFFWRTLPVDDPKSLVGIYGVRNGKPFDGLFSRSDYAYYRDHTAVLSSLAAHYSTAPMFLTTADQSVELSGSSVSANFFELLGIRPVIGRFLLSEEDAVDGRDAVAILSYRLWKQQFGGNPNIVGTPIKLNGVSFSVIGVAPASFQGVYAAGISNDIWIPLSMSSAAYSACDTRRRDCTFLNFVGRLADGRTSGEAQSELTVLTHQMDAGRNDLTQERALTSVPLRGLRPSDRSGVTILLRLLIIAAFILLLIGCINVSGLLLAQGSARKKEMATRLALGANRAQVFRQLLSELGILSCIGGAGGLLVAQLINAPLSRFQLIRSNSYYVDLRIDGADVLYTIGLVTLCALIATIVPAAKMANSRLFLLLKDHESRVGRSYSRVHDVLIASQVTLSLVLLVAAGLLLTSLQNIFGGPGYDPSHLVFVRVTPARVHYSPEMSAALQRDILSRLSTFPGIQSVSLGDRLPWWPGGLRWVARPGEEPSREEDRFYVRYTTVAPEYLNTVQVPLVSGRDFNDADRKGSPNVVITNETLERRMFPGSNAIDRVLVVNGVKNTIVGVAKDAQYHLATDAAVPFLYVPYWQVNDGTDARFCLRTSGDPGKIVPAVRQEIHNINADLPVSEVLTMRQGLEDEFATVHFASDVLASVGGIACFLSMIGLYGLVSYSVSGRTREIGIRIALGANRVDILRLVIARGLLLTLAGVSLGIMLALTSLSMLSSLLYGVKSTNFTVVMAVVILLTLVSMIASLMPARRATRVDPVDSIRSQ